MCSVDKCFGFLIPPRETASVRTQFYFSYDAVFHLSSRALSASFLYFFFISVSNAFCQVLLHNCISALCENFAILPEFSNIKIENLPKKYKIKKYTFVSVCATGGVCVRLFQIPLKNVHRSIICLNLRNYNYTLLVWLCV